ncbi:unnamed protein product [Vitrella brassicaformis CCMP3155]|uniref:Uncharacterized protein n=2 Tax=Vitrella brassicaformis TaxID=1169539 RepID=A0A0G4FVA9_VITBC|nr:unnamed protein product [Vitrella brassicaformis CCMP3155]|mmetsp:Transcript_1611/g.3486  ORF Transcript_1611/g.3486 Transcript_1611/m.3486 type:complete len:172 (+) Transcript_1611:259-774(+)|eukprot:CEM19029.1 unnamed protein product [Vitrella brassicaformis CCMP3155]
MAATDYQLTRLRVIYTAREKHQLNQTIDNLRRTIEWAKAEHHIDWPTPRRQARRQWRVTYIKGPFHPKSYRHWVFSDYRYSFTFFNVKDPRPVMSAVLGSMSSQTFCECQFAWHHQGDPNALSASSQLALRDREAFISREVREEHALGKLLKALDRQDLNWFHMKYKWPVL